MANDSREKPVLIRAQRKSIWIPVAAIGGLTLLLIAIVWGVVFTGKSGDKRSEASPVQPTVTVTAEPKSTDVLPPSNKGENTPGGTAIETKKALLMRTGEFLSAAAKSADQMTDTEFQQLIATGDSNKLTDDYKDFMVVNSILNGDKRIAGTTYASFLYVAAEIVAGFEGAKVEPIVADPQDNVFIDMEAGVAFVPLSVYRGADTALSINWVYVNGDWKIYPYSFLDGLQTAEIAASKPSSSASSAVQP